MSITCYLLSINYYLLAIFITYYLLPIIYYLFNTYFFLFYIKLSANPEFYYLLFITYYLLSTIVFNYFNLNFFAAGFIVFIGIIALMITVVMTLGPHGGDRDFPGGDGHRWFIEQHSRKGLKRIPTDLSIRAMVV